MDMNIGVSLPWNYLSGMNIHGDEESSMYFREHKDAKILLSILHDAGVSSIEFRHWNKEIPKQRLVQAFRDVLDAGMGISIHGESLPDAAEEDIHDIFPWMDLLFGEVMRHAAAPVMLVLHSVRGGISIEENRRRTVRAFTSYLRDIEAKSYPVVIAYENQRAAKLLDPAFQFSTASGVIEELEEIAQADAAVCWDMGHSYANFRISGMEEIPPASFIRRVKHTHIHALHPDTYATHWPLGYGELPLKRYLGLLDDAGYNGICNIELSMEKYPEQSVADVLVSSVSFLQEAIDSVSAIETLSKEMS